MAAKTTGKIKFDVNTGTGTLEFPDGLTTGREKKSTNPVENDKNKKETPSDPEWANDLLDSLKSFTSLADVFKGQLPTFFKDLGGDFIAEKLNPILGGIFGGSGDPKGNKENPNNRNKTRLKSLDPGYAAGFILIYNRLDDIYNAIVGKGDNKKDKEKGGFAAKMGNFFKGLVGLGANILAIAGAMVLFVGAMSLAKTMQIDAGFMFEFLGMFTLFVTAMVGLGFWMKKSEFGLKQLASGIMNISLAIVLFGAALWIGAEVFKAHGIWATLLPALMLVFIRGVSKLQQPLIQASPAITALAVFAVGLSLSLLIFGYALGVLEENVTLKSIGAASLFLIVLGLICIGVIAASPALAAAAAPIAALALFAVAFSLSLIMFGFALDRLNQIDFLGAISSIGIFISFILVLSVLSLHLIKVGALLAIGAVGAVLITASLAAFIVCFAAMGVLVTALNFLSKLVPTVDVTSIENFFNNSLIPLTSSLILGAASLALFIVAGIAITKGLIALATSIGLIFSIAFMINKTSKQLEQLPTSANTITANVNSILGIAKMLVNKFKEIKTFRKDLKNVVKDLEPLEKVVNFITGFVDDIVRITNNSKLDTKLSEVIGVIGNVFFPALVDIINTLVERSKDLSIKTQVKMKLLTMNLEPVIGMIMKLPSIIKDLTSKELSSALAEENRGKLNETLGNLVTFLGEAIDTLSNSLSTISSKVSKSFANSLTKIADAFHSLQTSFFGENGVVSIIKSIDIGDAKQKLGNLISLFDGKDSLPEFVSKITGMKDSIDMLSGMRKQLRDLPKSVKYAIDAVESIGKDFGGKNLNIQTDLQATINAMKPFFDYLGTIEYQVTKFTGSIKTLKEADIGGAVETVSGLTELNAINFDPAVHSIRQLTKSIHELGNEIQRISAKSFMSDMLENLTSTINAASDKLASLNNVDNLGSKFTFKNKREEIAESLGEEDPVQQNLEQIVDYLKYFKEMGIKQQGGVPIMNPAVAQVTQYGVDKELNSYFPS